MSQRIRSVSYTHLDVYKRQALEMYVEKLVFDGDGDAIRAMNKVMEERQQALLKSGDDMVSYLDEAWVHSSDFRTTTLTYEIAGINYLDARYVCVEADGYEYSGGAHGNPFRDYFVFDRETGKQLTLSDIAVSYTHLDVYKRQL